MRVCSHHVALNRNLANALDGAGDRKDALEQHRKTVNCCQVALQKHPDDATLYNTLGWSLWKLQRLEAAATVHRRAVAIEPASIAHRLDLSRVLRALGRYAENENQLREAVPQNADVLAALGHSLLDQGRVDAGLEYGARALAIDSDHPSARFVRARANFLTGRYALAWPDYVYRYRLDSWRPPQGGTGRAWEGQNLNGHSILLYGEQGLGDVIQFARYAPLVAQRGAGVVLCCPPALVGLLRRLPDVTRVVPDDQPCPRTDWACPLMDVPAVWGTDPDSIPAVCPYLLPVRDHVSLLHRTGQLRVGIVWAGNPANELDHLRTCRLDHFAPLFELPGTEFVSFQVGPRARELAAGWLGLVHDPGDVLIDLEATADALMEVDLVITVDTMLAHLAGALGRPVWTLLAFAPDWRWMLDRTDTPWYPTMRLFRQPAPNDWASVFREVRRELEALLARAATPAGMRDQQRDGPSPARRRALAR